MWKFIAFLLAVIATVSARPTDAPPSVIQGTNHTQDTKAAEYFKQVKHLSDDEIADLEQQGKQMLDEIKEKKIELEGKAKQQIEEFIELAKVLKAQADERADSFKKEAEEIKSKELPFNFNEGCNSDEDCNENTLCYPVDKALQTVLQAFGDIEEYELIAKKARISGNECVPKFTKETIFFEVGNVLSLFNEKKEKLTRKLESKEDELKSKGINATLIDTTFLTNENTEKHIFEVIEVITSDGYDISAINDAPTVRQLSNDKLSIDPLTLIILSQRGNDAFDTQSLLMSLMMAGSGASGDKSVTSNPLLLMSILDSEESAASDLLFKMTLLGGESSDLMSNPLLLATLLGEDIDESTMIQLMISQNIEEMNPLLLMSLASGDSSLISDPLMLLSLLGNEVDPATILMLSSAAEKEGEDGKVTTSTSINPITLLALPGELGREGGLDPITLMLLTQGEGNIDPITLLALTGGLGGEGGVDPMTLMLLTQGEGDIDPITLLALTGGLGEDIDPLTLMMLTQGGDVDPLTLMMLNGGKIDPITMLLMSGGLGANDGEEKESSSSFDPITLLALTGGLGGEGGLDPITLMLLSQGEGNIDPITLLALTGGLGGEGGVDPITLMLLTQGEGDIDPIILLALTGSQGDSSSLLPFILMSEDNAEDDSLLLFMLLNMQATS